jgi:hypothetical protein
MPPQDLWQALRRRPFVPFRVYVSDGTVYHVQHPELLIVSLGSAVIGLPSTGLPPPAIERYEIVDLSHVVRLEPLDAAGAKKDGQGS